MMKWWQIVGVATALLLTGCAAMMGVDTDPALAAPLPDYRVGDRWVYHVEDGYRLPIVWEETREVTAIDATGITLTITRRGGKVNDQRIEKLTPDGQVVQGSLLSGETRTFTTPWQRYRYPMHADEAWSQRLHADANNSADQARNGSPAVFTRALGWVKYPTPLGEVDTLRLKVNLLFDDENFWRFASHGEYWIWYAPSVNGVVYAEKEATYIERSDFPGPIAIPLIHETVRLLSYTRGSITGQ